MTRASEVARRLGKADPIADSILVLDDAEATGPTSATQAGSPLPAVHPQLEAASVNVTLKEGARLVIGKPGENPLHPAGRYPQRPTLTVEKEKTMTPGSAGSFLSVDVHLAGRLTVSSSAAASSGTIGSCAANADVSSGAANAVPRRKTWPDFLSTLGRSRAKGKGKPWSGMFEASGWGEGPW